MIAQTTDLLQIIEKQVCTRTVPEKRCLGGGNVVEDGYEGERTRPWMLEQQRWHSVWRGVTVQFCRKLTTLAFEEGTNSRGPDKGEKLCSGNTKNSTELVRPSIA